MNYRKKWLYLLIGGIGVLTIIIGAGFVLVQEGAASPSFQGEGPGWPGGPLGNYHEALAEALGISVDKLEAACKSVSEARLAEAVEQGLIDEDMAEQIGGRERGGVRRHARMCGVGMSAELAEELGITVDALAEAQAKVRDDLIAQAIEDGVISGEQVQLMEARAAIRPYMQGALTEIMQNAISEALRDGAISEDQADLLLNHIGDGPTRGGFGRGRFQIGKLNMRGSE